MSHFIDNYIHLKFTILFIFFGLESCSFGTFYTAECRPPNGRTPPSPLSTNVPIRRHVNGSPNCQFCSPTPMTPTSCNSQENILGNDCKLFTNIVQNITLFIYNAENNGNVLTL